MLAVLQEKDFERYVDFAYQLALDPARSGYPAYFDGIKTKEEFVHRAKRSFTRPEEEILLYMENGEVEGWIHYYTEENFLSQSTCQFRRNTAAALEEYAAYLAKRYPGYTWDVGIPAANREAMDWLEHAPGFEKMEESNHYQFFFDQYTLQPEPEGVERITEENFEKFRKIHQILGSTMYWNSQRILADLPKWDLFVAEEDGIAGEAACRDIVDGWYEVFALGCANGVECPEGLFRRLLTAAMNGGKARGGKYLPFFADVHGEDTANRILPELGFQLIGQYFLYRKEI